MNLRGSKTHGASRSVLRTSRAGIRAAGYQGKEPRQVQKPGPQLAEQEMAALRTVVSRLGVADVRAFGLSWEDCEEFLAKLGYAARVDVVAA